MFIVRRLRSLPISARLSICVGSLILGTLALTLHKRQDLAIWYHVRGLCQANQQGRDYWIACLKDDGQKAALHLLARMREDNPAVCENISLALDALVKNLANHASNPVELAQTLSEHFQEFTVLGQQKVLQLSSTLVEEMPATSGAEPWASLKPMITEALKAKSEEIRYQALEILAHFTDRIADFGTSELCRSLINKALNDELPRVRIRAIGLALKSGNVREVACLLNDNVPEVRRAAMLAVGPSSEAIDAEELLRYLHDSDEDVRKICIEALRSRGLGEEHLRLGRLLGDPEPSSRLRVPDLLQQTSDVDSVIWLRRLSHDPCPAVRAAAVRTSAERIGAAFSDRLLQMSQNDPSPTVRQLAAYYFSGCEAASFR
jgi:HEAT repeat protein